jgi:hypothetical protein
VWGARCNTVKRRLGTVGHCTTHPHGIGSRKLETHDHLVKTSFDRVGKDRSGSTRSNTAVAEQEDSALPRDKEGDMKKTDTISLAKAVILTLAEIKAAVEAFDRGETNAFDALDAIVVKVEAYRTTATAHREAA